VSTVRQLAQEADLDLDETLVSLWDAGFGNLSSPNDVVPQRELQHARRALALPTRRDFASPVYWRSKSGLSDADFAALLEEAGIDIRTGSRRLPKGSVKRIARLVAQRRAAPLVADVSAQEPQEARHAALAPLEWVSIGHAREMRYLTPEEIEAIHFALVQDFMRHEDPIVPAGVRDQHLFYSAVSRPLTSLGGVLKYPTIEMASAALLHSLVHNHPFFNGNKRTGLVSMLVFLDQNSMVLTCDEHDLFKEVILLAQHRLVRRGADERSDREVVALTEWIVKASRFVERGDRLLKFHQLRGILSGFDCEFDFAGVGNRINISRLVVVQRRRGKTQTHRLRTQVVYGSEGREVVKSTITKIRKDLKLDEEHGVDSAAFYDSKTPVDEFIATYRKTLDRLARL
jgi:death-on-curing family protein